MEKKAKRESKYLDIWKILEKNRLLMLLILSKYSWFWSYSPQNTKATTKYILGRDDTILKDKIILHILTALKKTDFKKYCHWEKDLHTQEQKL